MTYFYITAQFQYKDIDCNLKNLQFPFQFVTANEKYTRIAPYFSNKSRKDI